MMNTTLSTNAKGKPMVPKNRSMYEGSIRPVIIVQMGTMLAMNHAIAFIFLLERKRSATGASRR
jgi:hypothetical protein